MHSGDSIAMYTKAKNEVVAVHATHTLKHVAVWRCSSYIFNLNSRWMLVVYVMPWPLQKYSTANVNIVLRALHIVTKLRVM